ncbi:hypothetical protein BTN50_2074 [Candidatus Enterovibrio altilux]|uniref:Uncharacterized protein n=1 Tax=Candidatus Enterovibrio altilux TaxID=1927128 RepID=A0A291BBW4_9GAMM|nr:hypothetical protein BTN50_2074 [Candidatus Enterovibrio luxaltus]
MYSNSIKVKLVIKKNNFLVISLALTALAALAALGSAYLEIERYVYAPIKIKKKFFLQSLMAQTTIL